jgi:tetratricopeptide (TPR) repeat protein
MKNFYCGTFLLLLLALSSCQPPQQGLDAEDERNPYFRKGAKLAAEGNFHGAIAEYEGALRANPKVQKAYLEIGILYADKLNDPVGAAYHFQKYIDARPEAPNLAQVQTNLEKAKIDFALTLPNSSTQNAQEFAQISKENIELKQALAVAQESLARKEEEIAKIKSGTFTPTANTAAVKPAIVNVQTAEPVTPPLTTSTTKIPSALPVDAPSSQKVHIIQSGDNLWKIAKQYYPDDINGGIEKIKAANPQTTANVQNLKLGQKLVIP